MDEELGCCKPSLLVAWVRENPSRAALAASAMLLTVLLALAFAASWQRVSAADVSAVHVSGDIRSLVLSGSYRVDDGPWRPYETGQKLEAQGVGVSSIVVRGSLGVESAAGERINVRLSSTAYALSVNGTEVFSSPGIGDAGPASEPLLGWVGFASPGISADDEVEIRLSSSSGYCALGDYAIALDSLHAGDANALFFAMVQRYLPMFVSGLVVLVAGLVLFLVASVGHLIGVPKEEGGLRFALYVLVGGVWIFFCFDYITLLVPHPAFTTTVSLLAQDVLGVLLLAFVASRVGGRTRVVVRALFCLATGVLIAAIVLRLCGVVSLYNANIAIVPLFILACVAAAALLARDAWKRRRHIEVDAALVVLPCAAGMFVEGASFLVGGVTTGLWLCGGILIAVAVRFVALFAFARGQILQAERAQRMESEVAQSRVAVLLSQIQPHFLFNALNAIEFLCEADPPRAARTVQEFAQYLRGNMDSLTGEPLIPLKRELEHLAHYVAIEQLRFPNVEVHYHVQADDFQVPPLSVQPLVENAIRHGASQRRGGKGTVTLSSWREGGRCFVRVSDNGPGITVDAPVPHGCGAESPAGEPMHGAEGSPSRSHVGLANVEARLAVCGGALHIENTPGSGVQVTLVVPYDEESEMCV
ncbi:sensor histidine kinase [Raoultibacter phocaeensis]|uniref:sensor histidine kinase n=1 Tax=Raoultibacter phocaeensis TaxID=2479841 RepID=UPI0011198B7B|nr:histidine kinase [Raoultibacter phocaeensis]